MYVYVGVGVSAGVYLGWIDTEGFRMVGLQGPWLQMFGFVEAMTSDFFVYSCSDQFLFGPVW